MPIEYIKHLDKTMKYFHRQGGFLTSKNKDIVNTMTISWGSIGLEWGKPIFTIMVRKSRYTHDIIENSGEFTVSIPIDSSMKNALSLCGSKSGKDIDKYKLAEIKTKESKKLSTPVIDECGIYYECKVVYKQDINPEFLENDIKDSTYLEGDYHTIYYGEIVEAYMEEK